jgi:probable phosphoglycerate mutase
MPPRIVYLARHGETDWNRDGRWQGHTDVPLNDRGRDQARALGAALADLGVGAVGASDLSRAVETARIAGGGLGLPVAFTDPGLRERRFGVFEGLTRAECETRYPDAWHAWVEQQRPPEGGEGREELGARVVAAMARAVARADSILLVTHGGSIRAAFATVAGVQLAPIVNGAIFRFEWDGAFVSAAPLAAG